MSANPTPAQPLAESGVPAPPAVSTAEIDASCRWPVMILFAFAAVWLVTGSALALVASLKFHAPGFLADCPWFTYGRVHPAHLNAFLYGFAAQAALGVLLWLICRIGRARLEFRPGIIVGTLIWNVGVKLGLFGILYGESTGHEWLEMPRYASILMFCGYLLIGLGAMLTFVRRQQQPLYPSQWFLLAATFWFPWIYSTANFLLVAKTVRGALQAALDDWYRTNLGVVWLGFIALAALFYFVPKLLQKPLHSRYLGVFAFWTLAIFGSWGGIPAQEPVPSWMPALSTVGAVLTVIPVIAVGINLRRTASGNYSQLLSTVPGKFIGFGAISFLVWGIIWALSSLDSVSKLTNFTWFMPAESQLLLYGFVTMTLFGAAYFIIPRLLGVELSPALSKFHFWAAAAGISLYVLPLGLGGLSQGNALNLHNTGFLDVMLSTLTPLRISTTGDLLMALGHLAFLLNGLFLLVRLAKAGCCAFLAENRAKTAEVTP